MIKRRFLLYSMLSAVTLPRLAQAGSYRPAAVTLPRLAQGGSYRPAAGAEEIQARWKEFLAEDADVTLDRTPLATPHDVWRKQLPADSYAVLFEEDTEVQFSSHLNLEKRAGLYVCRACRLPLFTSEMKFDSGTGWPSFFTCIPDHLDTKKDFRIFLPRTEYHCVRCGGHQGHVFDDGPPPTRERWCNNGAALAFVPSK